MQVVIHSRFVVAFLVTLVYLGCLLKLNNWEMLEEGGSKSDEGGWIEKIPHLMKEKEAICSNYIIPNRGICEGKVDVLIWVHSAVRNTVKRSFVRKTWKRALLNTTLTNELSIRIVFALGIEVSLYQRKIRNEFKAHRDIVQINYIDVYHNVTYKAFGGMLWFQKYCSHARLFYKADDDILLIPERFIKWLPTVLHQPLSMYGAFNFDHPSPVREPGKYRISEDEWPHQIIANKGAHGLTYLMTSDVVPLLLKSVHHVPWVWTEDIWVTGTLPEAADDIYGVTVRRVNIKSFIIIDSKLHEGRLLETYAKLVIDPYVFVVGQMPTFFPRWLDCLRHARMSPKAPDYERLERGE